jgi:hypothetical protein
MNTVPPPNEQAGPPQKDRPNLETPAVTTKALGIASIGEAGDNGAADMPGRVSPLCRGTGKTPTSSALDASSMVCATAEPSM